MAMTSPSEDGRNVRRDRNIDRVIASALELFGEQTGVPSFDEIAQRAGISPRSVYRYFDDPGVLYVTVAKYKLEEVRERANQMSKLNGSLRERALQFAKWRWPMNKELRSIGDSLSPYLDRNEDARSLRHEGSRFLSSQIEGLFGEELDMLGDARAAVLASLRVLWSVESWSLLIFDMGGDREQISQTIVEATLKLLRS